ncbi:hypothetical protein SAMN05661096_00831 [Marivirga sericea]|uniref:Uncharacterized protein n=1 Tax=Marivirga sericea TaxID=1028 RepID=A0A1X7INJ3_9BACT|nr:hypothetical protein SAMN05661096_00831 [Marivirga sericea]
MEVGGMINLKFKNLMWFSKLLILPAFEKDKEYPKQLEFYYKMHHTVRN